MHTVVSLLQVLGVSFLERGDVLTRALTEQTALSDEGLVKIAVGVEQQADGRQMAIGQCGTGFGHLSDAAHSQRPHRHQQGGQQQNGQGNLPAEPQIGKYAQHDGTPALGKYQ